MYGFNRASKFDYQRRQVLELRAAGAEYDNTDGELRQVLLEAEVAISGDEYIEYLLRAPEQLTILKP